MLVKVVHVVATVVAAEAGQVRVANRDEPVVGNDGDLVLAEEWQIGRVLTTLGTQQDRVATGSVGGEQVRVGPTVAHTAGCGGFGDTRETVLLRSAGTCCFGRKVQLPHDGL